MFDYSPVINYQLLQIIIYLATTIAIIIIIRLSLNAVYLFADESIKNDACCSCVSLVRLKSPSTPPEFFLSPGQVPKKKHKESINAVSGNQARCESTSGEKKRSFLITHSLIRIKRIRGTKTGDNGKNPVQSLY